MAVAQLSRQAQVKRRVHGHVARALHPRLNDQGADVCGAAFEQFLQGLGGTTGHIVRALTALGLPRVWRHHRVHAFDQRLVCGPKEWHIGERQGAQGLAVVAGGEADKFIFLSLTRLTPKVVAHFHGDLHGRGAVACIKSMSQVVLGQSRELFGKFHHGGVGEAGEHDMLDAAQLFLDGGIDARVGVSKEVGPP